MSDGHKQFTGSRWVNFEDKQPSLQCAEDCPGCEKKSHHTSHKEEPKHHTAPKEETKHHAEVEHPRHSKDKDHGKSHRR